MKLRHVGFSTNRKGDLLGTLIALSDEGDSLGFEHTGNFSRIQTRQLFVRRCAEETGHSEEVAQAVLTQVLKRLREGEVLEEASEQEITPRPRIQVTGRYRREITQDAIAALEESNRSEAEVFWRGGILVRLREEGKGVVIQQFSHAALSGRLDRIADFFKYTPEGEERPARPPNDVVEDLLSLSPLPFPEIRALAATPVLVPGGRILAEVGFDAASGVYRYHNNLGPVEPLPLAQSREMLLDEVLGDFPFADQGSRANVLALLLQPFIRPVIPGLVPLHLIDAPARGTGKGLLVEVISQIALGQPAGLMVQADDEEMRKIITALLLGGHTMVVLDNVRSLKSDVLALLLTDEYWVGRVLGRTQVMRLENTTTWVATGNNVTLNDEMARRTVQSRLDAQMERPEERTDFRHPHLLKWVRDHRPTLVAACLGIVRAWLVAGMPLGTAFLGRYEEWAGMMSGLLDVAGVPGFLSNREEIYTESEQQVAEWTDFCKAWDKQYGGEMATAKQLLELAAEQDLLVEVRAGRSQLAAQQRMGRALAKRRDRVFGEWTIRSVGKQRYSHAPQYRLEAAPS